jgi:hypothetical protein
MVRPSAAEQLMWRHTGGWPRPNRSARCLLRARLISVAKELCDFSIPVGMEQVGTPRAIFLKKTYGETN